MRFGLKVKKEFWYDDRFFDLLKTQTDFDKLILDIKQVINQPYTENDYVSAEIYYSNLIENNIAFKDYEEWKDFILILDKQHKYNQLCYMTSYEWLKQLDTKMNLQMSLIQRMQRETFGGFKGNFKQQDNYLVDENNEIAYHPVNWVLTPLYVEKMIKNFNENILKYDKEYQFILIIKLMFDFLCIHPFSDGNGRVSRMLFYWLIKKYHIFKDINFSISARIWNHLQEYYDVLTKGNKNWENDNENISSLIWYFINLLKEGYNEKS